METSKREGNEDLKVHLIQITTSCWWHPPKNTQALATEGPGWQSKCVTLSFISLGLLIPQSQKDRLFNFQDSFQFHVQCSLLISLILLEIGQNLEIWILNNAFCLFFGRKNVVIEKACLLEPERQGFYSSFCLLLCVLSKSLQFLPLWN